MVNHEKTRRENMKALKIVLGSAVLLAYLGCNVSFAWIGEDMTQSPKIKTSHGYSSYSKMHLHDTYKGVIGKQMTGKVYMK